VVGYTDNPDKNAASIYKEQKFILNTDSHLPHSTARRAKTVPKQKIFIDNENHEDK
jgi:hypothetical protein